MYYLVQLLGRSCLQLGRYSLSAHAALKSFKQSYLFRCLETRPGASEEEDLSDIRLQTTAQQRLSIAASPTLLPAPEKHEKRDDLRPFEAF